MSALRLATLSLTAPRPRDSVRFYRWCLDLQPEPGPEPDGGVALSWGREDRVLVVPSATPEGGESFGLRMAARRPEETAAWLADTGLAPERVVVPAALELPAREAWPDREVVPDTGEDAGNRVRVRVRAPGDLVIELEFPLPGDVLTAGGGNGSFRWRSRDWTGLEIPGLLGVRTGVPDPVAMRSFAEKLGARPMEGGAGGPLAVGDHQWIVERREPAGIHGFAVVVPEARLGVLERTLTHVGVEHRLEGNRLLAADPEGRIVLIQGVRGR